MPNPDDQDDLLITTADGDKSSDPRAGKSAKALTKAQQARMDKLKLLRAARKSVRNAATRKIKDLDALLKDKDTETEDLEDHLTILLQREEELIDIDGKVESLIEDEDELMVERNDAINEREPITLYKAKTTRAIRKANGQNGSTYGGSTLILGTTQHNHGIKLQPIPITKFSGDHAKWPSFWARFKVTVEDNPRFSKVEKMIHLTSFLEGEALQAVQGFPEKDSSYQEIVDLLTQRYDKTHVVINEHMGKLIDIQPVRDSSDLKALRRLLDTCEISIRCLKTLGVNTANEKVSFICPALLRCIPKDIRTDYFVKRNLGNSNNWDADDLLQFFREQVECREMAELMGGKQGLTKKLEVIPYEKPKWKNRNEYRHTGGSAASLAVQTQQTEMYCIFCEGKGHKTSDCPNFTLEQKKLAIKTSGRCTNCLKTNHNAGNCFSKFKSCRKCRLKTHNFAVCDQNESHLKTPQNTVENIKLCSSTSVVQSVKGGANIVLLQTATAVVRNPSFPKNQGVARALLDGGSQISFVREDLARKLDLPIIGKETLDVYSFGEENPTERKTNRVKLILENRLDPKQTVEIEAVEVPFICHGVPSMDSVEIKTIMNQKGLQLADESGKSEGTNSELQILIGGDYYWRVVTGRNERFSKDVVAIETKLGWAIQGPTGVSRNLYAGRSAATMLVNLGQKQINETLNKFWDRVTWGKRTKHQRPSR